MIQNITKNSTLAKNFSFKKGFGKIRGLLGENEAKSIVFETRYGIHTFFLKFPIDLIVLNSKGVAKVVRTVKPNRIVFWDIRLKTVIELPFGTLKKTKTEIGDIIKFLTNYP